MKSIKWAVPVVAALMLGAPITLSTAMAADLPKTIEEPFQAASGWTYEFSQYGWFPGMKGDVGVFGAPPVDVDLSFKDIFNALDWGDFPVIVMMKGEVRNDKFGMFFDLLHLSLEDGGATPGPVFSSAELDMSVWIGTALGSYRVAEQGVSHLDAVAGLRVWSFDANLSFGAGILPAIEVQDDEIWVDPVVGLKGKYGLGHIGGLSDKLFIEGWGLIGGFGASSDFMWDVWGGLGYEVNDWFSASAGWRHIGVDYSKGSFLFDVDINGPMLDFSIKL